MTTADAAPRRRRSIVPAVVVSVIVAGLLVVPQVLPFSSTPSSPVFPRTVAAYSWWTTPLAAGDIERATVVYQNGVGVEFMDFPQAVVLGDDGSTYRRLSAAEGRSTAEDQGDPATSLLAPDGSFVVIGSGTDVGRITVLEFDGGTARDVRIGDGRVAVPQSITADGRTVLLLVGAAPMSRYTDMEFELHGELVTVDLVTGEVSEHPTGSSVNAGAISPDGTRILVADDEGHALIDVASGSQRAIGTLARGSVVVGAAFSPSGERFASVAGAGLQIDGVDPGDATHSWPLPGFEYAAPVGWRDEDTVLVQGTTDAGANTSAFAWVDASTGAMDVFSTYRPDATGAAMWVSSVAADSIAEWTIADTRHDRGLVPLVLALAAAIGAGALAWLVTPRRRRRAPLPPVVQERSRAVESASVA